MDRLHAENSPTTHIHTHTNTSNDKPRPGNKRKTHTGYHVLKPNNPKTELTAF
jgi:hypothetical protein